MAVHRPYNNEETNGTYNLLFCDDPNFYSVWRDAADKKLAAVFAERFDERVVRSVAEDRNVESRMRMLAFNRLRAEGKATPKGQLLGTIIEIPLPRGLDTLAVFADGRIRYINGSEKMVMLERDLPSMRRPREALMEASQAVIEQIGPWTGERLPPPHSGDARMTFLVSDGLYFGEASADGLTGDPLGGPVLKAASELLKAVVDFTLKQKEN